MECGNGNQITIFTVFFSQLLVKFDSISLNVSRKRGWNSNWKQGRGGVSLSMYDFNSTSLQVMWNWRSPWISFYYLKSNEGWSQFFWFQQFFLRLTFFNLLYRMGHQTSILNLTCNILPFFLPVIFCFFFTCNLLLLPSTLNLNINFYL